jgi:hypothetical protein
MTITGNRGLWSAIAVVLALCSGRAAEAQVAEYKGYETPAYTVERSVEGIELRSYPAQLVAEVTVDGDRSTAASRGFRVLAGYIFGGNDGSAKIAMTTPVTEAPADPAAGEGRWTIRFGIPSGWSLATLPRPNDPNIRFVELPKARMAVLRFSGFPTASALERQVETLRQAVERLGLKTVGAPVYIFYDSPFTLPWNRRNEVALTLP